MKFLILPNQLFDIKYFKNLKLDITEFICYEHPHYFKKFKYNKKKLILHRASLKYYFQVFQIDVYPNHLEVIVFPCS